MHHIFCPYEFGFDDGYDANYEVMQGKSVSYAASFGDPHFNDETYQVAMDLIEKGMKITTELTGYNKGGLTLCNKAV